MRTSIDEQQRREPRQSVVGGCGRSRVEQHADQALGRRARVALAEQRVVGREPVGDGQIVDGGEAQFGDAAFGRCRGLAQEQAQLRRSARVEGPAQVSGGALEPQHRGFGELRERYKGHRRACAEFRRTGKAQRVRAGLDRKEHELLRKHGVALHAQQSDEGMRALGGGVRAAPNRVVAREPQALRQVCDAPRGGEVREQHGQGGDAKDEGDERVAACPDSLQHGFVRAGKCRHRRADPTLETFATQGRPASPRARPAPQADPGRGQQADRARARLHTGHTESHCDDRA